jgi:hypothetical protein
MKKKERKVGGIKGFFMWLLGMDRTIQEVVVPMTDSEPIPKVFTFPDKDWILALNKDEPAEKLHKKLKEELGCETKEKLTIVKPKPKPRPKQNLSSKYNPNVKRGGNGRYESLK